MKSELKLYSAGNPDFQLTTSGPGASRRGCSPARRRGGGGRAPRRRDAGAAGAACDRVLPRQVARGRQRVVRVVPQAL